MFLFNCIQRFPLNYKNDKKMNLFLNLMVWKNGIKLNGWNDDRMKKARYRWIPTKNVVSRNASDAQDGKRGLSARWLERNREQLLADRRFRRPKRHARRLRTDKHVTRTSGLHIVVKTDWSPCKSKQWRITNFSSKSCLWATLVSARPVLYADSLRWDYIHCFLFSTDYFIHKNCCLPLSLHLNFFLFTFLTYLCLLQYRFSVPFYHVCLHYCLLLFVVCNNWLLFFEGEGG